MLKNLGNMGNLVKQAHKMQKQMQEAQEQLKEKVVEASSGGGMVTVKANGRQEILSVKIDPEVVNPEDVEMLEDLVLAAVGQAMKKAEELAQEEMSKLTGGLNIPGMFS